MILLGYRDGSFNLVLDEDRGLYEEEEHREITDRELEALLCHDVCGILNEELDLVTKMCQPETSEDLKHIEEEMARCLPCWLVDAIGRVHGAGH